MPHALPLLLALLSLPELEPPPIAETDVHRFGLTLEQAIAGRDFAATVYESMELRWDNEVRWRRGIGDDAMPPPWLAEQDRRVEAWTHLVEALHGDFGEDNGEGYRPSREYALAQLRCTIGQGAYERGRMPTPAAWEYFRPIEP